MDDRAHRVSRSAQYIDDGDSIFECIAGKNIPIRESDMLVRSGVHE